jgi:hypothetical protein
VTLLCHTAAARLDFKSFMTLRSCTEYSPRELLCAADRKAWTYFICCEIWELMHRRLHCSTSQQHFPHGGCSESASDVRIAPPFLPGCASPVAPIRHTSGRRNAWQGFSLCEQGLLDSSRPNYAFHCIDFSKAGLYHSLDCICRRTSCATRPDGEEKTR